MFRLLFVVAVAAAAPLEDTAEVAAAKEEFLAADEAVAAAKAAFQAAFDDAAAGGLAAKQAPAPVHVLPEPTAVAAPAVVAAAPVFGYYPAPAAAYNYGYLNYPYTAPYNLAAFSQYPYTGLVY